MLKLIMWFSIILCLFAFVKVGFGQQVPELPAVNITQGTVVGLIAENGNYFEFHGIPYADSTSGIHRFKAPNPAPSFTDTFYANRRDVKCVRALGVGYEGTEDCLVVNIFTPTLNNTRALPVMVWIKGREFDKVYEHELSFKNFVEKDVVVVSLNFRETILGFLCLGTETAPGNAGLKDIIAGLKWVQNNIAQFGGDPNNVSLFGHGSGAAAVDLITLSPMANGLVHRAIAQSGNAMAPWAVTRDNLEYAVRVAEALGHTVTNIEELSEIFTRTSLGALMAVINELDLTDNSLAFSPCIEKESLESEEPFLTKTPYITINEGSFLQIPFMTGFVDSEGTIRAKEALERDWLQRMETSFTDFIQPDLDFKNDTERSNIAHELKTFYFKSASAENIKIDDYISYHGDTMILVSAIREARMRALANPSAQIYLYQFSYKGSLGEPFVGPLDINSAAHSEELGYLFHDNETNIPLRDLTIGNILVERWTNFAKTGVPTREYSEVQWQPFTKENPAYLRILNENEANNTLEMQFLDPHSETMAFWENVYDGHFKDAESRWDLTERNDEEETDNGESSITDNENGVGTNTTTTTTTTTTEAPESEGQTDSASTTEVYTFSVVILFTLLSQVHSSLILS